MASAPHLHEQLKAWTPYMKGLGMCFDVPCIMMAEIDCLLLSWHPKAHVSGGLLGAILLVLAPKIPVKWSQLPTRMDPPRQMSHSIKSMGCDNIWGNYPWKCYSVSTAWPLQRACLTQLFSCFGSARAPTTHHTYYAQASLSLHIKCGKSPEVLLHTNKKG